MGAGSARDVRQCVSVPALVADASCNETACDDEISKLLDFTKWQGYQFSFR